MSNTRKATGATPAKKTAEPALPVPDEVKPAAVPEVPVKAMDELDRELAELRAQLAQREAEKADPRRQEIERIRALLAGDAAEPEDEKDRTIRLLKEQLAEKTATEEGAAAELRAALRALQDQVSRMQSGAGLIPVPVADGPAPYLYGAVLENGEVIYSQFPTATHHQSTEHGLVPIRSFWTLDPTQHERAAAWAAEQEQLAGAAA